MAVESFNISWNMFDINNHDGWGIGYCQHNSKHCAFVSFPVDALSKMSCMIIQQAIITDGKCSDGGWCLNGDCEYSKLTREQALSNKIKALYNHMAEAEDDGVVKDYKDNPVSWETFYDIWKSHVDYFEEAVQKYSRENDDVDYLDDGIHILPINLLIGPEKKED